MDLSLKSICVVSTSLSYCWAGRQQTLPQWERVWRKLARRERARLCVVDPFQMGIASAVRQVLAADLVVMTTLIPRLVTLLRTSLGWTGRFVIHTQGEATQWGRHFAEISQLLKQDDLFVSNSEAEKRALRLVFPGAHVLVQPCPLGHPGRPRRASIPRTRKPCGAYVGRISEQKNLHTVLLALWTQRELLLNENFEFHFFGREDGLGSPNMGISGTDYLRQLKLWTHELGLSDVVRWQGFRSPNHIRSFMNRKRPVFVSVSLHSDEDFGVAAYNALAAGCRAILSGWGGHLDFLSHFPEQTTVIPVLDSGTGPVVSPETLGSALGHHLGDGPLQGSSAPGALPAIYQLRTAVSRIVSALCEVRSSRPLRGSPRRMRRNPEPVRWYSPIFSGYDDPRVQPLFRAYGMRKRPRRVRGNSGAWILVPWAVVKRGRIEAHDPHRGVMHFRLRPRTSTAIPCSTPKGARLMLDPVDVHCFVERGLIISLPRES